MNTTMRHIPHTMTRCGINPSHAWRMTKTGELGTIVYCQSIAIDMMRDGYDLELGKVVYANDGSGREIVWGVF
jgi:hypothetical protein